MALHIVLVEPEIPHNTGSIARTCAVTGAVLHLIRPLGFSTDDRYLKRAGLDYWKYVDIRYYDSFSELVAHYPSHRFFCATTKAKKFYTDFQYKDEDFFVFGKETKGLPPEILQQFQETCIRVPLLPDKRSLNLSQSVGIIIYEALRQLDFPNMI